MQEHALLFCLPAHRITAEKTRPSGNVWLQGKQAGKAPALLSTATRAKAKRRPSDGAGDSTTEAAFRRMPGKQQQSARQRAAEEQTEEAERTPLRRLTRSTGNKEQAKGKVVRQPESR